jgi:catechol 2,3-dioxygenase-like lactoylglutathione lyase family enzyme
MAGDDLHRRCGSLEADFRPGEGGRLAALRYRGVDVVVPPGQVPGFHGDTFWPSPQSLFDWPPPRVLDADPYDLLADGPEGLVLRSGVDPDLGLQVEKRYTMSADSVGFAFRMTNAADEVCAVAPWQVTRAPRTGLIVWAPGEVFDDDDRLVKQREDPGCWYRHERCPQFAGYAEGPGHASIAVPAVTQTSKFFTDARGWAAHVHHDLVVLRVFPDLRLDQMAPRQAELELFFGIERDYIELESQGAYETLAPGQSLDYAVEWRVGELPPGVPTDRVTPGLLDTIHALLARGPGSGPRRSGVH